MGQFFSTILSQAYSRKKIILGGLAIAFLISLVPLQIAHAGFFDGFINVIIKGAAGLVDALVAPITLLVKFIAGLIGDVMYEAVKFFTNIPIVPPKAPDAIANGWNFTRNLVNIIFILILTFIGLATILRLQTYQLQKTLPSLIIIALLVNFSTVLVGFVVDIGNIFTNAFLGEAAGADWKNIGSFSFSGNPAANLATHVAEIFYYLFAILIYFVIILLFAVRTIILWVLTILSPIAFGAFILPATKRFWSQWLQQLIQWSILGIPISFSLLLAKNVLTSANFGTKLGLADGSAPAALMAPFTALVLLFVGITLSMQMAPAGAQGVIAWGKKAGMKTAAWAGREGWRKIGKKTEAGAGAVRKKGQDIATNAEARLKTENLGFGQRVGLRLSRWGGKALSATGSGVELGSQKGNLAVSKRDQEAIAKAEKGTTQELFDRLDTERATTAAKGGLLEDTSKELGAFTGIIKNGDTKDIEDRIRDGRMSWDFVRKMYKNAKDNGNVEQSRLIEKAFLSRTLDKKDAQGNIIKGSNELGVSAEDQEKIFEKIDGQDFKGVIGAENLDITTETGKTVMDEIIRHRGADLIPQFLRNANQQQRQVASEHLNSKGRQWFIDNNAVDVLRYSISPAAASLGINPIDGITQDELKELVKPKDTTEKLKEEMALGIYAQAEAQGELKTVPPGKQGNADRKRLNKKIKELEQRRTHIQAELTLREASDDELRSNYGVVNDEFQRIESRQRAGETLLDKDYTNMAALREVRNTLAGEFTRRKVAIGAPSTSPEDQPLSAQIGRLREKEASLREQAKLPYRPGEKAREELKKVRTKIKELEKRGGKLPAYISTLTQNELEQHRQDNGAEIAKIDSELTDVINKRILAQPASPERAELMKREEELKQTRNLVILEQRQLTEAYLIKAREDLTRAQKTKQLIEQELKTVKERRGGVAQGSQEEQAIIADEKRLETQRSQAEARVRDLTKQENEEYGVWQQFSNFERQQQPELNLAKELAQARTAAEEAQKKVLQLRTAKATADAIAGAARDLKIKKRGQDVLERKLTAQLAMNELQGMIQNTRFYPHPITPGLAIPPLDDLLVRSFEASIQDIQEKEKLFEVDTASLPRTEQDRIEREKTAYLKETEERKKRFKEQIEQTIKQERKI